MTHTASSLIYKVRKDGIPHTSWLVATMHVQDERAFHHFDTACRLMQSVDLYCGEVDIQHMQSILSESSFLMPEGMSLSQLLGEKYYAKAHRICLKAFGIDIDNYQRMVPIMLINQLTVEILNKEMPLPLDLALWQHAQWQEKELGGLETAEQQVGIMSELNIDYQINMLTDIIRDVSKFRINTRRLIDCFTSGDLHKLYKLSSADLGQLKHTLIYKRNHHMADTFAELHMENALMAAVGAGHFGGHLGMIGLLRRLGFSIKAHRTEANKDS